MTAGQRIATVRDDKIAFQVSALDAQLAALEAQSKNAEADLARGQALVDKGVATAQRLDGAPAYPGGHVARNQIAAAEAQRQVVLQQAAEGEVLAPADGRILAGDPRRRADAGRARRDPGQRRHLPAPRAPQRHAALLEEGARLPVEAGEATVEGRLAKIYPRIENGRVIADVDVTCGLPTDFVDARVLVRVPVGSRSALTVPAMAVATRSGLDFVRVREDGEGKPTASLWSSARASATMSIFCPVSPPGTSW